MTQRNRQFLFFTGGLVTAACAAGAYSQSVLAHKATAKWVACIAACAVCWAVIRVVRDEWEKMRPAASKRRELEMRFTPREQRIVNLAVDVRGEREAAAAGSSNSYYGGAAASTNNRTTRVAREKVEPVTSDADDEWPEIING